MNSEPWTMERLDTLRAMWADGKTCLQIAAALKTSRSAIAGKVRRLKLDRRTPAHSAKVRWENAPRAPRPKTGGFRLIDRTKPYHRTEPVHCAPVEAPRAIPVHLLERTGCCYPVTEAKPHLFCNAAIEDDASYCDFHHSVMYRGKAA